MPEENLLNELDCDDQLLEMFVSNAADLLDQIETDLLKLEQMIDWDDELVNKVFRSAHTIKGESGFVGLEVIGKLAHSIENVLDKIRERIFEADRDTINLLLECFDELRRLTEDVDNSNDADVSGFVCRLDNLVDQKTGGDSQQAVAKTVAESAQKEEVTSSEELSDNNHCETDASASTSSPEFADMSSERMPGDILIVDDDPLIQKLLKHHLNNNGVSAQFVYTCSQCLQVLRNNSYRVIILDFDLPDGHGLDIIREIKALRPMTQVIMLTGEVSMHNVVGCLEAGAIDFLPKSNNYDLIIEPILSALDRSNRWASLLNGKRQAVMT